MPASGDNKADGAAALKWMRATFPLAALALDAVEERHQDYLKSLLRPGSGHGRPTVLARLELASSAAARRQQLKPLAPNEAFALPECTDFVSYTRGRPHGSTATLSQRPRVAPFDEGTFAGAHACRPHAPLSSFMYVCACARQSVSNVCHMCGHRAFSPMCATCVGMCILLMTRRSSHARRDTFASITRTAKSISG